MDRRTHVFHHNDADGYCSKAWFRYFHNKYFSDIDVKYEEYNYGELELSDIKDQNVFFLDCNPEKIEKLDQLFSQECHVTIIDHHITSLERYGEIDSLSLNFIYDKDHSGCELTKKYFEAIYGETIGDTYLDDASYLVEDWDLWKFDYKDSEPFQLGLLSEDITDDKTWDLLHKEGVVDDFVLAGSAIVDYRDNLGKMILKTTAREIEFEGLSCLAINSPVKTSKIFIDEYYKYDCVMCWCLGKENRINVSVYSNVPEKAKLGEKAKKYGGGGHYGAAGFSMNFNEFFRDILYI